MTSTNAPIRLVTETQREIASMPEIEAVAANKAITDAFGNHFYIPLDFELIKSHMPFYQSALRDRLEYELAFNDYFLVIRATGDADPSYDIKNISLEYEIITQPELANMIANQYGGRLAILYDRVLRHCKISRDKSYTLWNINLNVPARSMKGILMLFEDVATQQPFARNTESFYNRKITKVEDTVGNVCLPDVERGKEAICSIRQKASPRCVRGGERPGPGRRLSGRISDKQFRSVAWPQDNRWWPAS